MTSSLAGNASVPTPGVGGIGGLGGLGGLGRSNIALHLVAMARHQPGRRAVVEPAGRGSDGRMRWTHLTFAQLDRLSDDYARGFARAGIARGTRTVLLAPPGLDFFAAVFALFKLGAVVAMIDPAIGRERLLRAIEEVEPQACIGIAAAQVARLIRPRAFASVRTFIAVGKKLLPSAHRLRDLRLAGPAIEIAALADDEPAAILFTSGSTGAPKGAVYTHAIFEAQVQLIRDTYGIAPGEIDLPTFPLFALFDPALGMTAILPEMDFRYPARAAPEKILEAIEDHAPTNMFASPALLDHLGRFGEATGARMPSLRRVLCAGAPVRPDILRRMAGMLDGDAQVFTPFGATESLPVASIGSRELLAETTAETARGQGTCVGRPVPGVNVSVIRISDEPIAQWSESLRVPPGEIGELAVRGPVVTREYWRRPKETELSKIDDGGARIHRMGDVGRIDAQGRIWMCGRKSQRVETSAGPLFSVPCEAVFEAHAQVLRAALVGLGPRGSQKPVIVVEIQEGLRAASTLESELRAIAKSHPHTAAIDTFLVYPDPFPVDVRHNAKIARELIAAWAARQLR